QSGGHRCPEGKDQADSPEGWRTVLLRNARVLQSAVLVLYVPGVRRASVLIANQNVAQRGNLDAVRVAMTTNIGEVLEDEKVRSPSHPLANPGGRTCPGEVCCGTNRANRRP